MTIFGPQVMWQPKPEVMPDELRPTEVFSMLSSGHSAFPQIPIEQWSCRTAAEIENPRFLDMMIFLSTDQPEACRSCGSHTDFSILGGDMQLHECLDCGERYLVELD